MIPVNEPLLGQEELDAVIDCVKSGWISSEGEYITEFERKWSDYCSRSEGIAVSNGTVALETALWALNLEPGSEVILPSFTIISCAIAILRNRLVPVLVDVNPGTWTMNVDQVAAKVNSKTRAIMPVHIYGHPVDMDPLLALANRHGLSIVEDAAEAHGAEYKGKKCGSFGNVSSFSFYANKLITTGEGGMVVTDNHELAERSRYYRNLCFRKDKRFYHTDLGNNYRMTNMQAAIGAAQVDRIDQIVSKKRWMSSLYTELLGPLDSIQLQEIKPWANSCYWMFGVLIKDRARYNGQTFASALLAAGVQTRPFFMGMHCQPVLREMGLFATEQYPVTDKIYEYGLYLPSGLAITEQQIRDVCKIVKDLLQ